MAFSGERLGGWRYGGADSSDIVALGDFDGDGATDFAIRSSWGLGIIQQMPWGELTHLAAHPWGTWLGGYQLASADEIVGVGNFDRYDDADELLVSGGSGLVILDYDASGELRSLGEFPYGSRLGSWLLGQTNLVASQAIDGPARGPLQRGHGVGDFDGDGRDEFLVRSSWGVGILRVTDTGSLTSLDLYPYGDRIGGWYLNASDRFEAIGRFGHEGPEGVRRDGVVVRSGWGLGILHLPVGATDLDELTSHPNGLPAGEWALDTTHAIEAVGDFDDDGRDDFILRSGPGLMVLTLTDADELTNMALAQYGDWIGSWHLGAGNRIEGAGYLRVGLLTWPEQFVIRSDWGIGILGVQSGKFVAHYIHQYGDLLGSWLLQEDDFFVGIGDFDGDGPQELLFERLPPVDADPVGAPRNRCGLGSALGVVLPPLVWLRRRQRRRG
jgi:hypothetical protein